MAESVRKKKLPKNYQLKLLVETYETPEILDSERRYMASKESRNISYS